jgi:Fe-S oxidoreductase
VKSYLDWSSYRDAGLGDAYADIPKTGGNFAKAVSVCINSQQCESDAKGVMCPSFRISANPALSPGGRVRLLKAALNSDEAVSSLTAAEIADAMDLCVACKGCKRECENSVDMAMIKVEYLAQQHARNKPSLRTRLIGRLSEHLHGYPSARSLARLRNGSKLMARLGEWLLAISRKRRVPQPLEQTCLERLNETGDTPAELPLDEVVLLIDTFTNNFKPDTGLAAKQVLERAGYWVHIAQAPTGERPLCCGRTHLANGLVEQAKWEAERMLEVLAPHALAGRRIIGLEPACLLAIRDDYRFLGLGEEAERVADQALLFEEFIAREISSKRFKLNLSPVNTDGQPLLVHGHCHQKAVGAMKSMRKVLKAIPGLEFELIEASCCGGAGSFSIEKEHADAAMEMAELSLLPRLREKPEAPILANGFSCQQQIQEGVQRDSMHLAELLLQASGGAC